MPVTYSSKIDGWLIGFVAVALVAGLVPSWPILMGPHTAQWLALSVVVPAIGLPAWLLLSTRYTITDAALLIRSGPLRWSVPMAEIIAVVPTRSPLSSPALSLDRLRIDYGRGLSIMISPKQRAAFMHDLEQRRKARRERSPRHGIAASFGVQ